MNFSKLQALLAASSLACLSVVHAEIASGQYSASFAGDVNLWDISGSYSNSFDLGDGEALLYNYTLVLDPNGKISGNGSADFDFGSYGMNLNMALSFNGIVSSARGVTRVNLNMRMRGSGNVQGYDCTLTATMAQKLEIDPTNLVMVGTAGGRVGVSVRGIGSRAATLPKSEVYTPLPTGMDGTWNVTVNVTTNRNRYSGSASVMLGNGESFPFTASGTYMPRTDLSRLTLRGVAAINRAMSLSLSACCTNSQMNLKSLSGRALGQSLKLPLTK